jgi:hypothetical protein
MMRLAVSEDAVVVVAAPGADPVNTTTSSPTVRSPAVDVVPSFSTTVSVAIL